MLSSIFLALFQAVAGDPAGSTVTQPQAETAAPAPVPARTERRRVCVVDEATVGGRIQRRRCHYEEVPVEEAAAEGSDATTAADEPQQQSGGVTSAAPAPTPD